MLEHIRTAYPDFCTYVNKVHESLDSWGLNESETLEAMGEEALGLLYSYPEEYLLSCNWMESFYQQRLNEAGKAPQGR